MMSIGSFPDRTGGAAYARKMAGEPCCGLLP